MLYQGYLEAILGGNIFNAEQKEKEFLKLFNFNFVRREYFSSDLELYDEHHDTMKLWNKFSVLKLRQASNALDSMIRNFKQKPEYQLLERISEDQLRKTISLNLNTLLSTNIDYSDVDMNLPITIYKENFAGNAFISIDMKEANFNSIRFFNPNLLDQKKTFESFVQSHKYEDDILQFLVEAKKFRSKMFGKLYPAKQKIIQELIMKAVNLLLVSSRTVEESQYKVFTNDELILQCDDQQKALNQAYEIQVKLEEFFPDIPFRVTSFNLEIIKSQIKNHGYKKVYLNSTKWELKCVTKHDYIQVFKHCQGLAITELDIPSSEERLIFQS